MAFDHFFFPKVTCAPSREFSVRHFAGTTVRPIARIISESGETRLRPLIGRAHMCIRGLMRRGIPGYLRMAISRDMELRIHGHLREIRLVNDDVIGSGQGLYPAMTGYERTLNSVAECATAYEVDEIAAYVKDQIQEYSDRPTNRTLRRTARSVVSRAGYPADEFLNKA